MIASLPMYDRAETAAANDAFWSEIRNQLGYGPETLTRPSDPWTVWNSPDLLLAQTCGLPYRARLHEHVMLVGSPDYGLPDCPPGYYRSVFVARADAPSDLASLSRGTFAYNEPLSQSGWAAPQAHMTALGLSCGQLLQAGAHRLSAQAVAQGPADFAALDAVTWELIQRHDDFAQNLRVVATTEPTPGLPLISARTNNPAALFQAVRAAIRELKPDVADTLHLKGIVQIPASAYLALPLPSPPPAS